MRIEVTSDDRHRLYLYDGKNFTVWARLVNYYATVPAPPTIGELFEKIDDKYDIELPLSTSSNGGPTTTISTRSKPQSTLAPATVEGVTCEHYAFHQEGVDWQIWIQLGEFPLPRKLVITTLTDDARPQHSDTLHLEPRTVLQRWGLRLRSTARRQTRHPRRAKRRRHRERK